MKEKAKKGKRSVKKKVLLVAIPLLSVVVITMIVQTCFYFLAPRSDPQYIAHMGYHDAYRGNTEEAFRAAATMDFYGIETDIRKSSSGVYVCHHDPLTNVTPEEEANLCTLADYLEICHDADKVAVIELKEDFPVEDVRAILDIVDQKSDRTSVSVISFFFDVLLRIKAEDPFISLQYLSEQKNDPNFDRCLTEGFSIDVCNTILTKKLVQRFHKAGLTVNVWTVNKDFDRVLARIRGVDFITSDLLYKN